MKAIKFIITILLVITTSGCLKSNSMDNIEIKTTAYPIEFIVERIYGDHSTISSIYPNDKDNDYIVSDKLLGDYSKTDLFIFNSNEDNENNYMQKMFNKNKNLRIINATASLNYSYGIEELWLDPIKLLTIANNIKRGFQEYTDITYLLDDINKNYEQLKIELIQLDADYREMANRANKKQLIVSNDVLAYLTKYGFEVISLENNDNLTQKTIHDAETLLQNGTIKTIYSVRGKKTSKTIEDLATKYQAKIIELDTMYTLSEEERKNNDDYLTIMYKNLELLKEQLYD